MPLGNSKINSAKQYLSDFLAFNNYSHYPERGASHLNSVSCAFLKKNNYLNNWRIKKPELTVDQLTKEGMSKTKAELCLFLVENRTLFDEATVQGNTAIWSYKSKTVSTWERHDFIDRYYALANWVFEEQNYSAEEVIKAAIELDEIRQLHLPEKVSLSRGCSSPTELSFAEQINRLTEISQSISAFASIKEQIKEHPKLEKVIARLEKGARSNNPYWMNSSKKLDLIYQCLDNAFAEKKDIGALLIDKKSDLSKAIDKHHILSPFSSIPLTSDSPSNKPSNL